MGVGWGGGEESSGNKFSFDIRLLSLYRRILGTKQGEHRPSLHRFISTYSWADAEDERCDVKTTDAPEPPEEETVEKTRKPSLSERRSSALAWDSGTM